jgi:hypothetical protein
MSWSDGRRWLREVTEPYRGRVKAGRLCLTDASHPELRAMELDMSSTGLIESLLRRIPDYSGHPSLGGLYRLGLGSLFTIGLGCLWAAVDFGLLRDWMWATGVFALIWTLLRLWYAAVRRERALMMAFIEMSDLHVGYLRWVKKQMEPDPPDLDLWSIREFAEDGEAFWAALVKQRLSDISELGVERLSDSEVGMIVLVGNRYTM